ncbi:hypothetical protein V8E55_002498 [Tylopilus felleus]
MATYKVESVQTGHYIISVQGGGEHHGDVVSSSNMAYPISMYADMVFSSPVEGPQPVVVTIKGQGGHYIGYNPESPIWRLLWLSESDPNIEWWVAKTDEHTYRFYPKNGADLYWYMNESTVTGRSGYVGLAAGKQLTGNEPLFRLHSN